MQQQYYSVISNEQELTKKKVSDFAEIWECQKTGKKSLVECRDFFPGDIIAKLGARKNIDKHHYLSVQISDAQHILLKPEFLQYINHSCDPNVFLIPLTWLSLV